MKRPHSSLLAQSNIFLSFSLSSSSLLSLSRSICEFFSLQPTFSLFFTRSFFQFTLTLSLSFCLYFAIYYSSLSILSRRLHIGTKHWKRAWLALFSAGHASILTFNNTMAMATISEILLLNKYGRGHNRKLSKTKHIFHCLPVLLWCNLLLAKH